MRFLNPNKVNLMFRLFRNVSRTSTGSRWLRRPLPLLAVGVAALLSASPATSADYRWRFNSSGSYLTPSNWELWTGSTWVTSPGIPGPSDRIFFDLNSSPSGYASSAIPRQVQSVTVMSGATGTLGFGFQSLQVGLGGMTIGSNAQLNLLNGTFSSSNVNLSSNGTLVVSGTSTSLTTSFIGTGNVASLDAGRLEVTSGANVSAGTLAHTTSSVDSQDNYHIVGASVTVSNSLALTNYSAKVRVGNDGLLDAGNATGATAFIHTVALDNGVFLGRAVNITNLVGHGIYASTDGAISNNQAGVAPTGAVVLDVSRNLQIRDTYAFAFSNAVPQIRGAITLGGGSFTTGSGASAHGLELVGTGKIVGFGTLNLNDGGLVGASTSIVEATGGTLQIQQNGNSVFGGAFAGTGEIEKTGAGHLALEGSAANYTHTGRIRVSDGTLTARRETTNPIKGLVTVDGGNLHIETSNQIVDNSMVTVDRGRFRINGGTNGISESIALLIGNGGAVEVISHAALTVSTTLSGSGAVNYLVDGENSLLRVNTGMTLTGAAAVLTLTDNGLFDAGTAGGISSIQTINLANGAFLGRNVSVTNVNGHGIFGSTSGTITNNNAAAAPNGAVLFDGLLNVRDLTVYAYSNVTPKLNGRIIIGGGGSFHTGTGASVGGLELLGGSDVSGEGVLNLGNGGLTGGAATYVEATTGTLEIRQQGNTSFHGAFRGASAIRKTGIGTLTLADSTANFTFTGTTRVSEGSLDLGRGISDAVKGPVLIDGGTLRLSLPHQIKDTSGVTINSGTLHLANVFERIGSLSGTGGTIDLDAFGELVVNNAAAYAGAIRGAGRVITNGGLTASGIIAPGTSAGNLTFNGGLTMNAGTYEWELAALTTSVPGVNFDLITSNGGATTLGGASQVAVDFIGVAADPNSGDPFWTSDRQWTILTAAGGSLSGNFGGVANSQWWYGHFSLSSGGNQVFLNWTFAPVPEPSSFVLLGLASAVALARRRSNRRARVTAAGPGRPESSVA